jgi:hypothetical protein
MMMINRWRIVVGMQGLDVEHRKETEWVLGSQERRFGNEMPMWNILQVSKQS